MTGVKITNVSELKNRLPPSKVSKIITNQALIQKFSTRLQMIQNLLIFIDPLNFGLIQYHSMFEWFSSISRMFQIIHTNDRVSKYQKRYQEY